MKHKWTKADPPAAEILKRATLQPVVICTAATSNLPVPLQGMPGVASYFVSAHPEPVPIGPGVSAAGEMVVVRQDPPLAKAYNYVYATSSGGGVYFTGPFKGFRLHHMASTSGVAVSDLFGHSPWPSKK